MRLPKYAVHVFETLETETVYPFNKPQEAHSYMVFQSRKLAGEFYKIVVTSNGDLGRQLEIMMGKLARR